MGSPQLRTKCLLQKTVLLLQQQQHAKALDSAQAVLKLMPDCKHAMALLATAQHKTGKKKPASATLADLTDAFHKSDESQLSEDFGHPLELTTALLVEMHRTKDALKLLGQLLQRASTPRQQPLFFAVARLYAKHGLNKDQLIAKLPTMCSEPPDRRTWDLLKSMAECTPIAVESLLQKYISEAVSRGQARQGHTQRSTAKKGHRSGRRRLSLSLSHTFLPSSLLSLSLCTHRAQATLLTSHKSPR